MNLQVSDKKGVKRWERVEVKLEDHIIEVEPAVLLSQGTKSNMDSHAKWFNDYLSKIGMEKLSHSKPLWEVHVIKYLANTTLVFKIHHSIGDGYTMVSALISGLKRADDPSLPLSLPSLKSSKTEPFANQSSSLRRYLSLSTSFFTSLSDFARSILRSTIVEDHKTPIRSGNDGIDFGPSSIFHITFPMDQIRDIKSKLGVTVNDVITGIIFYGIRLYMQDIEHSSGTKDATLLPMLNIRNAKGYETLKDIEKSKGKSSWGNKFTYMHAMGKHFHKTMRNSSLLISNLVGPVDQLAMGNHPIKDVYFTLSGVPQSVVITIISYMGMLKVTIRTEEGFIDEKKLASYFVSVLLYVVRLLSKKSKEHKRLHYKAQKMELTITQPDDWHLHLRDGDLLEAVIPHSARHFGRAIVMPNLKPPITSTAAAVAYRESILKVLPKDSNFTPLMTLYLTDVTSRDEIKLAKRSGVVYGVKLYPAGATTHSEDGVTDLFGKCFPALEEMVEQNIPLLVHGEVTDPNVDIFDREKVFIETILKPLTQRLPQLKIVMEHITTMDAVKFVESCKEGYVAATVTPQHLLLNRNSLFQGGLRPHNYCLPVLKREIHRQAIVSAVTSGSKRFFLGTDSAPHERRKKECSCGCAGIYNSPVALSLYAKVFEEAGALDKLEAFTSFNGPDFYGLPRNTSKIKLRKSQWRVPESLSFTFGEIVPMFAGETLEWEPSLI
ncbi:dihydroorotase, mitochondrial isoform X1 [Senna tora]|uniref:Dihydroorotase, mitochondrial n=1 Tax=Senna tora TaxID=362788 RepID=A0A834TKI4_9FABA|nr:dihydroorotase, mitochondrial isoform X1 [Senna tora]